MANNVTFFKWKIVFHQLMIKILSGFVYDITLIFHKEMIDCGVKKTQVSVNQQKKSFLRYRAREVPGLESPNV